LSHIYYHKLIHIKNHIAIIINY